MTRVNSIRSQLMIILSLCYLIPALVLGLYTRVALLPALEKRTEEAITSSAENAWTLTLEKTDRALALVREATYDGELTDIRRRWRDGEIGDSEFLRMSRNYLNRKYSRESLFRYAVFFPTAKPELLAAAGSDIPESAAGMQALRGFATAAGETLDTRCLFTSWREDLVLIRNLLDLRMERYGMLILCIDRHQLFSAMEALEKNLHGTVSLRLDDFGSRETDWKSLTPGLTESQGNLIYTRQTRGADYDFALKLTMDRHERYREYDRYRVLTAILFIGMIPVLGVLLRYVSRRIVRPIRLLSDASRRIEAGELGVTVPMRGGDELGDLGVAFSGMSLRLEELINRTYRKELELKNARILALQSRINPHFINNALEDINWQARIDGAESVSAMVTSLSVLLNAAMARDNRHLSTLREEMEVADAYIFFVEQRFGDALEIRREIAENAMEETLPLMTVQPLLENAVEHGIAPAGGGSITIRAEALPLPASAPPAGSPHPASSRSGNDAALVQTGLRLEIINTGRPLAPENREKIEAALRGENTGPHMALANIVNRLRLIYGNRAEISLEGGEETCVRLFIPREQASPR